MTNILKLKEERTALEIRGRELSGMDKLSTDEVNELRELTEKVDALNVRINASDTFKEEREVPKVELETETREQDKEAEYRKAFETYIRTGEKRALGTATPSAGGYITPVEMANEITKIKGNEGIVRQLAKAMTVNTETDFPIASGQPTAGYVDENGSYSESDNVFSTKNFKAKKFGFIVKVAEELLADSSFNVDAFLAEEASKAITDMENDKFCKGNGTTEAEGFLINAETGVTCASPTAITDSELTDLIFSLKAKYRAGASFVMNSSTLSAIRKLAKADSKEIDLTRADGRYILEGYPVYELDEMPSIATGNSVIAFGDFSNYMIADRLTFEVKRLVEKYADAGQVGFRFTARNDAHLMIAETIKVMKMG